MYKVTSFAISHFPQVISTSGRTCWPAQSHPTLLGWIGMEIASHLEEYDEIEYLRPLTFDCRIWISKPVVNLWVNLSKVWDIADMPSENAEEMYRYVRSMHGRKHLKNRRLPSKSHCPLGENLFFFWFSV